MLENVKTEQTVAIHCKSDVPFIFANKFQTNERNAICEIFRMNVCRIGPHQSSCEYERHWCIVSVSLPSGRAGTPVARYVIRCDAQFHERQDENDDAPEAVVESKRSESDVW